MQCFFQIRMVFQECFLAEVWIYLMHHQWITKATISVPDLVRAASLQYKSGFLVKSDRIDIRGMWYRPKQKDMMK